MTEGMTDIMQGLFKGAVCRASFAGKARSYAGQNIGFCVCRFLRPYDVLDLGIYLRFTGRIFMQHIY
jgi:hypothetical protein